MHKTVLALVLAALISVALASSAGAASAGRYIVVLKGPANAGMVAADHARAHRAQVGFVYEHALDGYSAQLSRQAAARIAADPRVAYVEEDAAVQAFAQTLPTGANRIDGELSPTAAIDGVDTRVDADVAVIDTGVDLDHPDLNVNVAKSVNCSGGSPMKKKCSSGGDDDYGHGTHVAGTVGALDNGYGVVGVAPGARIWSVKVLNSRGSGYTSWIIAGIDYVTANAGAIEVANMSLGGSGYTSSQHTAIKNSVAKGVFYAVAAGNDIKDVYGADGKFGTSDDIQPASYPEVSTISALADADGAPGGLTATSTAYSICTENRDDSFACFSNFSNFVVATNPVVSPGKAIDLMLPGYLIYSTYLSGGYSTSSGTSMAAPHGAGLAALYVAKNGRATTASGVASIRQALINSGKDQASGLRLAHDDEPDAYDEPLGWASGL